MTSTSKKMAATAPSPIIHNSVLSKIALALNAALEELETIQSSVNGDFSEGEIDRAFETARVLQAARAVMAGDPRRAVSRLQSTIDYIESASRKGR